MKITSKSTRVLEANSATQHGPLCLGSQTPSDSILGDSEDCLFADVFTPAFVAGPDGTLSLNKTKLPVFLWITGGGYTQLFNSNYNGTYLVQESGNDIVVVTFNYRVGPFGFLAGEQVAANGSLNNGLLDQRFFFQWVQQHIDKFGGDPSHVTLDGTSAGAGSVLHHLTAYSGRNDNLFQAGISDSLFVPFQPNCSFYQYQFDAFANATGCASDPDPLACLRAANSSTLQAANIGYPYPNHTTAAIFPYGPCVDGDLIADTTDNLLTAGKFIQVPLLLGNDQDEGSLFVPNSTQSSEINDFFANNYPLLTPDEIHDIIFQWYLYLEDTSTPMHGQFFALAQTAYGESTLICPSINLASTFANASVLVWNYRYAVVSPANAAAGLGTPHTYQDAAYWGPGSPDFTNNAGYAEANAATIPLVSGYWTSFVKTYDVNAQSAPGSPAWTAYGSEQNRLLFNGSGAFMETVPADQNARCGFWLGTVAADLSQ